MVFGHKGLPRKLPKANIARCWTWRSCDFTALSAAPLELCWEIEIPPRRYFQHLSPTRQNTLNTPFKDQGRVWWLRPHKHTETVAGGETRRSEKDGRVLLQKAHAQLWYGYLSVKLATAQNGFLYNVYVSNIIKYPEIRQIRCVHWYPAEASAEERGRGAKFMRWDGGGNTFPLMSRDYSTYHCRTELSMWMA